MKKSLAALVLAGALTFAGAAAASADTYPAPGVGQGQVSNGTVTVGQQFIFSGTGFAPFESITITITLTPKLQSLGASGGAGGFASGVVLVVPAATQTVSAKADANGAFSVPLTLDTPGTYELTATGLTSGHSVTATVTVVAAAAAAATNVNPVATGSDLASTGVDGSVLVWSLVGAGAVAAGASTVVVARRRSRASA